MGGSGNINRRSFTDALNFYKARSEVFEPVMDELKSRTVKCKAEPVRAPAAIQPYKPKWIEIASEVAASISVAITVVMLAYGCWVAMCLFTFGSTQVPASILECKDPRCVTKAVYDHIVNATRHRENCESKAQQSFESAMEHKYRRIEAERALEAAEYVHDNEMKRLRSETDKLVRQANEEVLACYANTEAQAREIARIQHALTECKQQSMELESAVKSDPARMLSGVEFSKAIDASEKHAVFLSQVDLERIWAVKTVGVPEYFRLSVTNFNPNTMALETTWFSSSCKAYVEDKNATQEAAKWCR